jgi:hemolysin D
MPTKPQLTDPIDFLPAILRTQEQPPAPYAGVLLKILVALVLLTLLWAVYGRLDIVAVAEGKLVPEGYLKIVQPSEQGIVRAILVEEGQEVKAGAILIRMDPVIAEADIKALLADFHARRLGLRRIDAQLEARPLARLADDPPVLFGQILAQYDANRLAYESALAGERSVLDKAQHDVATSEAVRQKLLQVLPFYAQQEQAFEKLNKDGFAGRLLYTEKQRERVEKEQDLHAQDSAIRAARATIAQSEKKIAQITADYFRALQAERGEIVGQFERAQQELAKQQHRHSLLELKAPQSGIIKDLATHTVGTVVAPGTIMMTLVPKEGQLRAEVWLSNEDVGFVRSRQPVKIKLTAFQFQKYGMLEGSVGQVSADASESTGARAGAGNGRDRPNGPLTFRTLVDLKEQHLQSEGDRHRLAAGMHVTAEINLGTRSVLEYVLSPVQKAFHEAGRER